MTSFQENDFILPFNPVVNSHKNLNSLKINSNSLKLLYMNVRSVHNKIEDISNLLDKINSDTHLIALTETWLKDDTSCLNVNNYNVISVSRAGNRRGGGCALLIHKSIKNYECINTYTDNNVTILSVNLNIDNSDVVIVVVYNPPNNSVNFLNIFQEYIQKIKNKNCIIIGDMNIDLLKCDKLCDDYQCILNCNNFHICNDKTPTRTESNSVLDHVIVNNTNQKITLNNIKYSISDHNILLCEIHKHSVSKDKNSDIFYKKIDYNSILKSYELNNLELPKNSDVNRMCEFFISDIQTRIKKCTRTVKIKQKLTETNLKPWITTKLKQVIEHKHYWFNKLKNCRQKTPENSESIKNMEVEYNYWRNLYTREKRNSKKEFFDKEFIQSAGSSQGTWKTIKKVIADGIETTEKEIKIKSNGSMVTDDHQLSNMFNDYFSNAGGSLASGIPNIPFSDYQINDGSNMFILTPTCKLEIEQTISNLRNTTSFGIDGVNTKIIKLCSKHISGQIADIINQSFAEGIFPDCLKISKVIPIFKSGCKYDFNNYRPISLTPVVSKIFEIIYKKRLMKFLELNNILCKEQYGFRRNCGTKEALFDIINCIEKHKSTRSKKTAALFIDLKKAFDTVDLDILMVKLNNIGFTTKPLQWISSFVCNRSQVVSVNGVTSGQCQLKMGVPQGSVLGPLLFLLYINSLSKIHLNGELFLYADDVALIYHCQNSAEIQLAMNSDLEQLLLWTSQNRLTINVDKTKYLIFNSVTNLQIDYNNRSIEKVNSFKYLGVIIDSKLSFKSQIESTKTRLARIAGVFWRISKLISFKTKRMLYFAFFSSVLEYGLEFYGVACSSLVKRIQIVQNRAIKNLYNIDRLTPTLEIHRQFNLLPVSYMYELKLLNLVHSVKNNLVHSNSILLNNHNIHDHNTRGASFIHSKSFGVNTLNFNILKYNQLKSDYKILSKDKFASQIRKFISSNL